MAWSRDDERMLAQIERHLIADDPRLAARLESFNERVRRRESAGRARESGRGGPGRRPRGLRRSTVVILVSWLVIATLIATLLVMALPL